jgi:hypothetical protein
VQDLEVLLIGLILDLASDCECALYCQQHGRIFARRDSLYLRLKHLRLGLYVLIWAVHSVWKSLILAPSEENQTIFKVIGGEPRIYLFDKDTSILHFFEVNRMLALRIVIESDHVLIDG